MPADGQAREDDHERMATSHSMLSQILLEDAKMAEGESREALFSEVMEELELAKQAKYNPGQDYSQAIAYLEWGKYQECIRICDGLRQEYPDFSGAVKIHQKACAKLYDASGVVGTISRCASWLPIIRNPGRWRRKCITRSSVGTTLKSC